MNYFTRGRLKAHSFTMKIELEIEIEGTDRCEYPDVECTFSYEPGERQTWDHPGCPEILVLEEAKMDGKSIFNTLTKKQISYLEEYAYQRFES